MPMRDGTGPQGRGPKTGRGWGVCSTKKAATKKRKTAKR